MTRKHIALIYTGGTVGMAKTAEGVQAYLQKYVFGVAGFEEYLDLCGGIKQLSYLKRRENLREPMIAPWRK